MYSSRRCRPVANTSPSSSTSTAARLGLITIEDILEEIVGEITDEYDNEEEVTVIEEGSRRVPSRYPVDELDEIFGVTISDDEVDSVGGLMAKLLGKVPIPGSSVEAHGLKFTAEEPTGRRNRIGTVLIRVVEHEPVVEAAATGKANGNGNGPWIIPSQPRTASWSPWLGGPVPASAPSRVPRSGTPMAGPTRPPPSICRRFKRQRCRRVSRWRSPQAREAWRQP